MNFEYSSGGIVYKKDKGKIFWLITRSSPSKLYPQSYWRLPKGWLDGEGDKPDPLASGKKKATENELEKAALREVKEEGGVEAKIIKKIDTIKLFFTKDGEKYLKFVTFYLMKWEKDSPEGFGFETSEVGWFDIGEAKEKLKYKNEKEILQKAYEILSSSVK